MVAFVPHVSHFTVDVESPVYNTEVNNNNSALLFISISLMVVLAIILVIVILKNEKGEE